MGKIYNTEKEVDEALSEIKEHKAYVKGYIKGLLIGFFGGFCIATLVWLN